MLIFNSHDCFFLEYEACNPKFHNSLSNVNIFYFPPKLKIVKSNYLIEQGHLIFGVNTGLRNMDKHFSGIIVNSVIYMFHSVPLNTTGTSCDLLRYDIHL